MTTMKDRVPEFPTDRHFLDFSETCSHIVHFGLGLFFKNRKKLFTRVCKPKCIDALNSLYGKEAPSYISTVEKLVYERFQRGRVSLQVEFSEGPSKSVIVPQNLNAVREMLVQDYYVTYREVKAFLGITATNIKQILHAHLAVKKVCSGI